MMHLRTVTSACDRSSVTNALRGIDRRRPSNSPVAGRTRRKAATALADDWQSRKEIEQREERLDVEEQLVEVVAADV
jgi:hypothetical protein